MVAIVVLPLAQAPPADPPLLSVAVAATQATVVPVTALGCGSTVSTAVMAHPVAVSL
jgi:hypothetical protein